MKYLKFILCLLISGCVSAPKPEFRPFDSGWRTEGRSFQECMKGMGITENSAGGDGGVTREGFTGCKSHDYDFDGDVDLRDFALWEVLNPDQMPDMIDGWLVLFNRNNVESEEWKNWYLARWNIPDENALGLDVSNSEKIDVNHYVSDIYTPIRNYLRNNSDLNCRIIGLIVGFRVPGNFDRPAVWGSGRDPRLDGGGGYSVANALMHMSAIPGPVIADTGTVKHFPTFPNKHFSNVVIESPLPVPNRFTLGAGCYLTARLDGPTLEDVKRLTPSEDEILLDGFFYYDAFDPTFGEWGDLSRAPQQFPSLPWVIFNSDTEGTPDAAFRASWHRVTNWDERIWEQSGTRFLAMEHNSWGATTVRSTTFHNNRFVPVALFQGGYMAAIGATAEPFKGTLPDVNTLWHHLIAGERLGVATFMANPHANWMWELIGDPLLKVKLPS